MDEAFKTHLFTIVLWEFRFDSEILEFQTKIHKIALFAVRKRRYSAIQIPFYITAFLANKAFDKKVIPVWQLM